MADQETNLLNLAELPDIDLSDYRLTPKFVEWQRLYLDRTNKDLFGNATQCAIVAYNLDPQTQYGTAKLIGHKNITKYNQLALTVREYLDETGFTLPVLIAHALEKMGNPKVNTTHWWKEVMLLAGYQDPKGAQVSIKNSANAAAAAKSEGGENLKEHDFIQISPDEERQMSREFADFVNAKYVGKPAMNPDAPQK